MKKLIVFMTGILFLFLLTGCNERSQIVSATPLLEKNAITDDENVVTAQVVEDFLFNNYLHIFTGEYVWENLGENHGIWYAGRFSLFEVDDSGIPGINITFEDAGSTHDVSYFFINGKYQRYDIALISMMYHVDNYGRLIRNSFNHETQEYTYLHYIFNDAEMHTEHITDVDSNNLIQIRRLEDLEDAVTDSINKKIYNISITKDE